MGKCDFVFDLDGDGIHYRGGDTVKGRLTVRVNESINCKALTLEHKWATHGSGNVTSGKGDVRVLHQGPLSPGDVLNFDFSVNLPKWPLTYHGHHLNIDHSLVANVDIPWAFDANAEKRIIVSASAESIDPEAAAEELTKGKASGTIIGVIAVVIIAFAGLMLIPVFLFLAPLLAIGGGLIWFFKYFLPKRMVGEGKMTVEPKKITAGEVIRGDISIAPAKQLAINGVTATLTCDEICVSGSGSNRKTHRHRVIERQIRMAPEGMLPAGQQSFPIEIQIPATAPPTLKLGDNQIVWNIEGRVDIPRWPDFSRQEKLVVRPAAAEETASTTYQTPEPYAAPSPVTNRASKVDSGIDFLETANFLVASRDDREQIDQVVAAVRGMEFAIRARIERTALYTGESDRDYAYPDGRTAYADHADSSLKLTLYFPSSEATVLNDVGRAEWDGRAVIMGYDSQHDRLQMRVLS